LQIILRKIGDGLNANCYSALIGYEVLSMQDSFINQRGVGRIVSLGRGRLLSYIRCANAGNRVGLLGSGLSRPDRRFLSSAVNEAMFFAEGGARDFT
jgi:hypothetical protein